MANKDGFGASLDQLDEGFGQTSRMTAEFEAELARLRQSMTYTAREVGTLNRGIESGLRRAFDDLIFDGAKLSDALKGIGRSIADTVYSIAMKPVESALAGTIGNSLTGMVSGALPFANGGAFVQGRVMPFAKGGVVSQPTHFPMRGATGLMGEAGPEAIMPLRRGADGRLGVAAASGNSRPVNVTVNVSTPDVAGFQRSQSQIAAQLGRVLARGNRNS
ncbi:phage tail tape measure protein [Paracoccus fistulariae]|uniref:Phage tail tape measure protein n=1 Tax=Paracoccus fistulariae TaxID=658446 RepID=A0ABY7SKL0_9RHOB|nr:phage tail tape measure protein [Paracoccus fistulariae]MDB6181510.1 phage tail tape measure protein [Paracoccus fistulariae]WCR07546.1 phage tail tape measure protein [Paracoccus fistulariae]